MTLKSKLVLLCLGAISVLSTPSFGEDLSHEVAVTYAFVPKDRLSDAVKDKTDALAIEAAWRNEFLIKKGSPAYPLNLGNAKYSIVVFIEVPARFAIFGKLGIPVQNPKIPSILNVSLSPGYAGTYVIDGGGLVLTKGIPLNPKPYTWIDFHAE